MKPGIVVHSNPSPKESETGRVQVPGHPGLSNETPLRIHKIFTKFNRKGAGIEVQNLVFHFWIR